MSEGQELSLVSILPVALAIGVFGVIYGAAASEVIGPGPTLLSSVIVFSGAAQFSMVGLLASDATGVAVLIVVAGLGLRHLPLGAVIRPRLEGGIGTRLSRAWFLIDETAGLAVAGGGSASRTLLVAGTAAYVSWVGGTALGVLGADLGNLEALAQVVFPVLFVGLAALTTRGRSDAVRAVVSGLLSLVLLLVWPEAGALGCMVVAALVCLPGGPR
jgi:predicted branched-subunit amino acid permease